MKERVEIITCPDGDWTVLKVNDKIFDQGHTIDWIELLKYFGGGIEVKEICISNEQMEIGDY